MPNLILSNYSYLSTKALKLSFSLRMWSKLVPEALKPRKTNHVNDKN